MGFNSAFRGLIFWYLWFSCWWLFILLSSGIWRSEVWYRTTWHLGVNCQYYELADHNDRIRRNPEISSVHREFLMGVKRYTYNPSRTHPQMEDKDQLHSPATVLPKNGHSYLLNGRLRGAQSRRGRFGEGNISCSCLVSDIGSTVVLPVAQSAHGLCYARSKMIVRYMIRLKQATFVTRKMFET
jgi:hypothetical protein